MVSTFLSRRGFLAAAVPSAGSLGMADAIRQLAESPIYLVVLTAKSKRCARGTSRVAHVTTDLATAKKLAGKLAKRFGERFVSVRTDAGKAVSI